MRKNLKEARKAAGLTQQQMAEKIGKDVRMYQRYESGETNASYEVWDALEDILGIHQRILREKIDSNPSQGENQ